MSIIKTILWVLLAIALVIFSINNWNPVEIKIWEDLLIVTKIPALVIVSFLAGLLPTWLILRGTRWQLRRRINSLETAVRSSLSSKSEPAIPPADEPGPPQL
jgi:uncharacterized integral membrane protein